MSVEKVKRTSGDVVWRVRWHGRDGHAALSELDRFEELNGWGFADSRGLGRRVAVAAGCVLLNGFDSLVCCATS